MKNYNNYVRYTAIARRKKKKQTMGMLQLVASFGLFAGAALLARRGHLLSSFCLLGVGASLLFFGENITGVDPGLTSLFSVSFAAIFATIEAADAALARRNKIWNRIF